MSAADLRHYVYCRITVDWVLDKRSIESIGFGSRKSSVPSSAPLHRRPYPVPVAEIDVIAHADLIAVIDDGSAWQRHQHSVHQLDAPAVIIEQRSQPAPNSKVQPHRFVFG